MLNGAHSMLAYSGYLAGCPYVRDVMAHPGLSVLVSRHMTAAAATLHPLDGIDYQNYAAELAERFKNPALAHETYQIAMDGTEKLPQRLLLPAVDALMADHDIRPFAFAVAAWMRYCMGFSEAGENYELRDPRQLQIAKLLNGKSFASDIRVALQGLDDLFPDQLKNHAGWSALVDDCLDRILQTGMNSAIEHEASLA